MPLKSTQNVLNLKPHTKKTHFCHMTYQAREILGADMFTLNSKAFLCVVHYHRKFPVVKVNDGLSADSLIKICTIIFSQYKHLRKLMADTSKNFVSEKF